MSSESRQSAELLLRQLPEELTELKREYAECVKSIQVTDRFRASTLSFLVHNRAILDFLAVEIAQFCSPVPRKIYLPIAQGLSQTRFRELLSKKWLPGLDHARPDIFEYLDSIQHYHPGNAWIAPFASMASANKHIRLSVMVVHECEAVVVRNGRTSAIQIGDRGLHSLTIQEGGSLRMKGDDGGYRTIRGPQVIDRHTLHLDHADAGIELLHQAWREFKFDEYPYQPAITFLEAVATEVGRIAAKITDLIDTPSPAP